MSFKDPESGSGSAHGFDALLLKEIAEKAEEIGAKKARVEPLTLLVLSAPGGAFIALGGMFATTVLAGAEGRVSFGGGRLAGGGVYWFVYLRERPRS